MFLRQLFAVAAALCFSLMLAVNARAQFKLDLQTCEDIKVTGNNAGTNTVETATCIKRPNLFAKRHDAECSYRRNLTR